MTGEFVAAAGIGFVSLVAAWSLKPQVVLSLSVVLAVAQIFPLGGLSVSIAAIWQLASWITVLRHRRVMRGSRLLGIAYGGLVVVSICVMTWSTDPSSGATLIAQLLGLGATVSLALICRGASGGLRSALPVRLLAAMAVVSAISVIVFRFDPSIEHLYFLSRPFGLLNGQDLANHIFTTERNNVVDDAKSGGLFFVNANAASLFAGACGALFAAKAVEAERWERRALAAASAISVVAALATGSKTAVYLAAAAFVAAGVLIVAVNHRAPVARRAVALGSGAVLVGVAIVLLPLLPAAVGASEGAALASAVPSASATAVAPAPAASVATSSAGLATESVDAIGTRTKIWRIAGGIFVRRPLGTLGYGGWHDAYAPAATAQGLNPGYPPHDWLIQTWSETGPLGVLLVAVVLGAVARSARRAFRAASHRQRTSIVLASIGLGWVLIHGLADNTGFYGGPRLIPVVALIIAAFVLPRGAADYNSSNMDEERMGALASA